MLRQTGVGCELGALVYAWVNLQGWVVMRHQTTDYVSGVSAGSLGPCAGGGCGTVILTMCVSFYVRECNV